jgi:actin-like ATPase involved in cell morphogenesis
MNLIAIDFGTERTKIAFLDPRTEQPELVRIGEDVPYWPSLFHISSDGNVSVGDDANKLREDSPGGVVDDLKRRFRDTAIRRNRQKKTPTELLSELFTKLRETANRTVPGFGSDPVTSVVLTHPASFGPGDKKVMESAAKDSGFKSVTLISEPVAAAHFWMVSQGTQQDNVVVLDCGGGTVDWAFLRKGTDGLMVDPKFPPGGDDKLGGRNIDDEILEYVTECLENQEDQKGLTKLKTMKSWFRDRIRRKKELFNQTSYEQDISVTKKNISLAKGRVTAEKRFVQQVLTHIKAYIEPIKNDLGENPAILLVGGSANLEGIREQVEQETQCKVVNWDRCDWAPVLGAVSYGHEGLIEPVPAPVEGPFDDPSADAISLIEKAKQHLEDFAVATIEPESYQAAELINSAIECSLAACDLEPEWAVAPFWKGEALSKRGDFLLAIAAYTAALRADENYADAWLSRGVARLQNDELVVAKDDLDRAIELDSSDVKYLFRALVHRNLGEPRLATNDMKKFLDAKQSEDVDQLDRAYIMAIAGVLFAEELNEIETSLFWFSQSLASLPLTPNLKCIDDFTIALAYFDVDKYFIKLEVDENVHRVSPWHSIQDRLWRAIISIHGGCTLEAVMEFSKYNHNHDAPSVVWTKHPDFAYYQAVIHAENNDPESVLVWLLRHPRDHSFVAVLKDKRIQKAAEKHPPLKSFLQPIWAYTENHGMFWNHVTVTNHSPFALSSVVVSVRSRQNGKVKKKKLKVSRLEGFGSKEWKEVFTEGGFGGNNISNVDISLESVPAAKRISNDQVISWHTWFERLRECECGHRSLSKFFGDLCPECLRGAEWADDPIVNSDA